MSATADVPPLLFGPDHPAAVATRRCLLCAAPSVLLGAFLPADSTAYGAPVGMDRAIFYGLCAPHAEDLGTSTDLVEGVILETITGAAA